MSILQSGAIPHPVFQAATATACHRIVEHGWAYRQPESLPLLHIWGFEEENPGQADSDGKPENK
ncbi:hypothetical protein I5R65_07540 [Herbaspirillum sp. AP02]|uniref:hypothetical protein n=1 Tax=unclassified Herbaspirillum TaxID=2624150 RepID=UPI0015D9AF49|nr:MULTISPECIES: hypothetical protein [unclassified Herbaspirillum]MBG7619313.1 hypothetical protein [Herbaspirillum sp. AP02]NZD66597.1 hypothetical protein [Herbaspirillum sp. AP21]